MKTSINTILGAAFAVALASTTSFAAHAADYEWKFQSSDTAGTPTFEIDTEWTKRVEEMTNGRIKIELLPVGAIVEHSETQDAIAAGILDGHITDVSYFSGKDPAFSLIANPIGAWADPQQMFRFMNYGGGNELMNKLEGPYGLHFIGATTPGLESFVSTVPINGVADLKGLKVRAPEGMVQEVFAAAGAAPVNIPQSEVYTSLDKKVIDAADATVFATNQAMGLNDIAKYPVYPGFHSMPLVEVSMNKEKWDALPKDLQAILTVSVRDLSQDLVSRLQMKDREAVAADLKKGDIHISNWSDDERAKFRQIAMKQWKKVAERSANAEEVYQTLIKYLTSQGLLN
jgi:TRAP-type mannitol/chloroaromatic compound transport system substrate-binding protein